MQSWHDLPAIHRANQQSLRDCLRRCDELYGALAANDDVAAADAIDASLAEDEARVWTNVDHGAASLACWQSLAAHLRRGGEICHGEREPSLSASARLLRSARMSGAVDQARADGVATELEAMADAGAKRLQAMTDEFRRLCQTLDVARANQRLAWLRRCALANPEANFSDVIREVEKRYAAARLAFQTSGKGAAS
ncbi:hypothetical protein [Cupriavidus sp. TA19]|nr:hypothetical protein [Cupriavidus sp. TA19]